MKQIEEQLYAHRPLRNKVRRCADARPQELYDLEHDHHIFFEAAEKHDKWSSLAAMRAAIAIEKIIIDPSCVNLIYQLEGGVWNKTRKDFQREKDDVEKTDDGPVLGHLDAIAALMYGWRAFKDMLLVNPFPVDGPGSENVFVGPGYVPTRAGSPITNNPIQVTSNPL